MGFIETIIERNEIFARDGFSASLKIIPSTWLQPRQHILFSEQFPLARLQIFGEEPVRRDTAITK